ncbi:hypothetical protein [Stappia sp.]|uniref:hypothetical protein n=1 Tax=Stappia sp. TaxID=1870903 RepID=UPI003D09B26E
MAAMFICARLSFNSLKPFTKPVLSVHAFLKRGDIAVGSKSAHMTLMMTIHKIHQLSLPIAMWGAGIAVFATTLSLGVAFSDVEASVEALEQQPAMTQSRAIASTIEPACEGIIFREEDPDCFSGGPASEAAPMPTLAAEPARSSQSAGS